ncbi:MAG: molybdopterin-dependent oxidoreductase [Chloroflexi bacterium]|nr:molybdopterin-dependent oxidoreductase [Chloroflexota bacterium]
MAVTQLFGASVRRREDPRLITGRATYTDDLQLPGMLYAAFLRSPHAHARIRAIDVEKAKALPGVVAVYTGADLKGKVGNIACAWLIPDSDLKLPPHPPLAIDRVRYVGDAVAVVVANDRYVARDALDLIEVDYEVLPAVAHVEKAVESGAPQLHDEAPGNVAFRWKVGGGDVDKAFAEAEVVVRERIVQQRLIPNAMETRGCVASWNPGTEELTIWMTSQNPHIHRVLMSGDLGVPEHKLRIIAPEVGGGFGSKIPHYPEESVVAFCSMQLGRPVKWQEDRRENYLATTHGRDHVQEVAICGKRDGTITGIRARVLAGLGAYLSTAAPGVPTILFGLMLSGAYRIPNISCETIGVLTNTTPVDAYRGAGRPEATFIVERMVDRFAQEIGMDPVEVRRKNFIPADAFPYTAATGLVYDSGNYQAALDQALAILDYPRARAEQQRLRSEGKYLGIGFSTYVELCGLGPSGVAGAVGFQGGLWENAVVRVHPTGKVTVFTGASPHGQGEETTFAQIVASELGIPLDDIEVVHGDTSRIPMGWGTYGSRTTAVGGSAVALAARKVREKAKKIAAHLLEVGEEDVEFQDGTFFVRGARDRAKTIQDVTLQAYLAWNLPPGVEPGLEESSYYDPKNFTYPFGAHIAVVEVDAETGRVMLRRYIAVDDCGNVINPMIVDGQVHGGIAQGIGQALLEEAVYSEDGQLLTGSMMDYVVPRVGDLPTFELGRTVTPAPDNPIGAKGVGETGTIAASAAIVNAVCDALAPLGIKHFDMPASPEKIWRLIQQAKGR